MVAQHGIAVRGGKVRTATGIHDTDVPPIRYDAVRECLETLTIHARELAASVHMPRIGCGVAGGTWDRIEPLITATLCAGDVPTTIYDLKPR
ncbi:hypothetical protein GCM10010435_95030 [Winogradskya consettensis]|uniref:Macro domain-containing protein n=1 Tax=Winogradskya consettensis TaxID=113560 RepID=A0A919W6Q4_9ACTN|nr:hypothetical protein [Actinoplanes consettensis]GIM84231.1 hypothetical protein Aco04nite_90390 [Actinoplanes consettensis]